MNLVVCGLGPHARNNILPALQSCSGVKLYGICSRNPEVVAQAAADYGCQGWVDFARMLADPKVEGVCLSTPIGLHAAQGREILLAGKHFWCEKPLASSVLHVSDLVSLSRERGVTIAEGFMYLYHPQFLRLQEIMRSRALGKIQNVTCRFGIPPLTQPGFRNNPDLAGGAFWDIGSYPVSAVSALFPDLVPEVVLSDIVKGDGSPVDSSGRAILRYDGGAHATLEWAADRSYRNEIDIWGTLGSVSSELFFSKPADYVPRFRFLNLNGSESCQLGEADDHFSSMFNAFYKLLSNSVDAENERKMIVRRAQLMDKIKTAEIRGKQYGAMEIR
ncbi:MAG: Gfo/Idh/MocA family oxidoreductase [Elusimicrobia bacterium]|nr:Gfo/Idh/MocA family oxidoreductase [Elusimicrobiota bacterium]